MIDIKDIWKNQPVEETVVMNIKDLTLHADHMHARISRRNLLLYAYSAFNIVCIVVGLVVLPFPKQRPPELLMLVAHLFVLWQVWMRFTPRRAPLQNSGQAVLQFHRQELERQHGAVARAWLWYIAPFMPPFIWQLAIWYGNIDPATPVGTASMHLLIMVILSAVFFWSFVWLLFSRHATRLELELERLSRVRTE